MREHIKHASDGLFKVVAFFIGLLLLLFILMAFSSMFSTLFNINDSATLLKAYFTIGSPIAIVFGLYHSRKKNKKVKH